MLNNYSDRWAILANDRQLTSKFVLYGDLINNEQFTFSDEVAKKAVPPSAFVNTHTIFGPKGYICQVTILASPLSAELPATPPGFSESRPAPISGRYRYLAFRESLEALRGRVVDIQTTRHGILRGYQLTSVDISTDVSGDWTFNLSFAEIRVSRLRFFQVPVVPAAKKAKPVQECRTDEEPSDLGDFIKDLLDPFSAVKSGGKPLLYSLVAEGKDSQGNLKISGVTDRLGDVVAKPVDQIFDAGFGTPLSGYGFSPQ